MNESYLFSLESMLDIDEERSSEGLSDMLRYFLKLTFFVRLFFVVLVIMGCGWLSILKKLNDKHFKQFMEEHKKFFEELANILKTTKNEYIKFIETFREELSKFYTFESTSPIYETFDDIIKCINEDFTEKNLLYINKKSIEFKEFNIEDHLWGCVMLFPKDGISDKDIKSEHYNFYDKPCIKYNYSKNYLTHHNNKVIKIFKSIKHPDCILPKSAWCLDTNEMLHDNGADNINIFKKGAIVMKLDLLSNLRQKILELTKKYNIEDVEELDE